MYLFSAKLQKSNGLVRINSLSRSINKKKVNNKIAEHKHYSSAILHIYCIKVIFY